MRDSFDAKCTFTQPETSRFPIAFIACAALLALVILGSPAAHPETPREPARIEAHRNLPAPVAQPWS